MNEGSKQIFWENAIKFGIRIGHNLSYLDTLQYIDNTSTTLKLDFAFNNVSNGTSYSYVFATGSKSWYSMEYDRVTQPTNPRFYLNIGTTTNIDAPIAPYKFGERIHLSISTTNGSFELTGKDVFQGSYSGMIVQDKTLTIGAAVNRNLQEGSRPTIEDALKWIRSDITVFGMQILKSDITVIDLQPALKDGCACFKDSISKKLFYSNGPDAFEIDENTQI